MYLVSLVLQFVLSIAVIVLVLIHSGKGGGLSDMFGGGLSAAASGSTAMERQLTRITVVVALLFSFNTEECRDEFDRDPAAYCDKFGVTGKYKEAIIKKDFLGMLRMGANIYYMAKMAIPRGTSVQDAGAAFQGITTEEFQAKLLAKRDGLEERLAKEGGYWNG